LTRHPGRTHLSAPPSSPQPPSSLVVPTSVWIVATTASWGINPPDGNPPPACLISPHRPANCSLLRSLCLTKVRQGALPPRVCRASGPPRPQYVCLPCPEHRHPLRRVARPSFTMGENHRSSLPHMSSLPSLSSPVCTQGRVALRKRAPRAIAAGRPALGPVYCRFQPWHSVPCAGGRIKQNI
jgi:hypothetical protein